MPNTHSLPATDSSTDLRNLVGDDATADFENDPKFVPSDPTASASSENLSARSEDDEEDSDEEVEDDEEGDEDLADDEDEDEEDDDDEEEEEDDDDDEEDDEDLANDEDEVRAASASLPAA
jgi:hypothetical protein